MCRLHDVPMCQLFDVAMCKLENVTIDDKKRHCESCTLVRDEAISFYGEDLCVYHKIASSVKTASQ